MRVVDAVTVSLKITGLGWLDTVISDGRQTFHEEISDVHGGGLPEIVDTLVNFCESKSSQWVEFELEPGNPVLRLDHLGALMRVRIGGSGLLNDEEDWADYGLRIDFFCAPNVFVKAVYEAVSALVTQHGYDGINTQWDGTELTEAQVSRLRNIFSKGAC
jgi:hypothetical protein